MNAEVLQLFSMPFYTSKLDLNEKDVEYIKCVDYEFTDVPGTLEEKRKYGLVSKSKKIHEDKNLFSLIKQIDNHVNHFIKDVLKIVDTNFFMTSCWAVKHEQNHWAFKHKHQNCLISGILYIDVSKNCGNIVFEKPANYLNLFHSCFRFSHQELNVFTSSSFFIEPQNGVILLFPSHLEHYVEPNFSEKDRYCISFDYFPKMNLYVPV